MTKFETTAVYTVPGTADALTTLEDACMRDVECSFESYKALGNEVEVLKDDLEGDTLDREMAIHPRRSTIPFVVRMLLGADALDYVQKTTYNFSTHTGTLETKMQNETMGKLIESKGTFSLRGNAPFAPRKVTYNLDTDIEADIFLIGKKVEKSIVAELHKRSPKLEAFNQKWVNSAVESAEATPEATPEVTPEATPEATPEVTPETEEATTSTEGTSEAA